MARIFLSLLALAALSLATAAAEGGPATTAHGTTYELIGAYDAARLDKIGSTELADFEVVKTGTVFPPAKNAVKLYRVAYLTVIPERSNRPVEATGLVAVPDGPSQPRPLVSYQHGTVFSRTGVPSSPEESDETRLVLARFAAQGYVVIAADYIGKGSSTEPDSYMVRESMAQACFDMLVAARHVLADLKQPTTDLFLSGWSQGAWNTRIFLRRLEELGELVTAAATAATPSDLYLLLTRWIHKPTDLDAAWIGGVVTLFLNSYERYYALPGLTRAAIRPAYWQTARDFYENKIGWSEASKVFPKRVSDLLTEDFAAQSSLIANRFYRQLFENQAWQGRSVTPARCYYGAADEVMPPYVATLPAAYQEAIGGAETKAVSAGEKADHRGAFVFGLMDQKEWFDGLRK